MTNWFIKATRIVVTIVVTLSLLSHSSSSITLSSEDACGQPLSTKIDDGCDNEWLLNHRGGNFPGNEGIGGTSTQGDADNFNDESKTTDTAYSYRTVQVQVVHRHGDRTPITPLKNKEYWAQQLVPRDLIERVATGTRVLRHRHGDNNNGNTNSGKNRHAASGRGPFGQLSKLGLLGMIQVGTNLKEDLEEFTEWSESTTASNIVQAISTTVGTNGSSSVDAIQRKIKFTPKDIKVYSTDFARTIQSVQGLLVGFFPEGFSNDENSPTINIDCRDTISWMIPDPQPRQTKEQTILEQKLAQRPHILEREALMRPLAVRCTQALLPLLGEEAFKLSFGVEDVNSADREGNPTLPWIQLTEITKCLSVRDMLPKSISMDDQAALSSYTAWKWFQSLRSPRLAYLSMRGFTETLVRNILQREREPPLIIYSCHDSSLIGLLCALNLEQPDTWPDYGAVLKIELLEKISERRNGSESSSEASDKIYVLRFYLNGALLRSIWHNKPRDEISMEEFISLVATEKGRS